MAMFFNTDSVREFSYCESSSYSATLFSELFLRNLDSFTVTLFNLSVYFYSITTLNSGAFFFHLLSSIFSDNFVHCVPPSSWTFLIPLRYQRTISSFHNCFILSYFVNSFKHFPHLLPKVPAKTSFLSYPELRFSCTFSKRSGLLSFVRMIDCSLLHFSILA